MSVPIINEIIKSQREKAYIEQITLIEERAQKWGVANANTLGTSNVSYYLTLDKLIEENLIEQSNIKDPRNNEIMAGCIVISYDSAYNQHTYTYNIKSCDELSNELGPTWSFDNKLETVEVNEPYYFPTEVRATSSYGSSLPVKGPSITLNGNSVDVIDSKQVGDIFIVSYQTTDPSLYQTFITSYEVRVVDTSVPTILIKHPAGTNVLAGTPNSNGYFNSNHTIEVYQNSVYSLNDIETIVNDNSCMRGGIVDTSYNNCSTTINSISRTGSLSTSMSGTYMINYVATDSSNNQKNLTLTIRVSDSVSPVIESIVPSTTAWTTGGIALTVNAKDTGVGLSQTAYSFNNGAWQSSNVSPTYTGAQNITVKVRDAYNNQASQVVAIESRNEYGYQNVSAWSEWSTTNPNNPYSEQRTATTTVSRDMQNKNVQTAGYVSDVCYLNLGVTSRVTAVYCDVDIYPTTSYSNYVSAPLRVFCLNDAGSWITKYNYPGGSDPNVNMYLTNLDWDCKAVAVHSLGNTGGGRNATTALNSHVQTSSSVLQYRYATAFSAETGWRTSGPYTQTTSVKPVVRLTYHYKG